MEALGLLAARRLRGRERQRPRQRPALRGSQWRRLRRRLPVERRGLRDLSVGRQGEGRSRLEAWLASPRPHIFRGSDACLASGAHKHLDPSFRKRRARQWCVVSRRACGLAKRGHGETRRAHAAPSVQGPHCIRRPADDVAGRFAHGDAPAPGLQRRTRRRGAAAFIAHVIRVGRARAAVGRGDARLPARHGRQGQTRRQNQGAHRFARRRALRHGDDFCRGHPLPHWNFPVARRRDHRIRAGHSFSRRQERQRQGRHAHRALHRIHRGESAASHQRLRLGPRRLALWCKRRQRRHDFLREETARGSEGCEHFRPRHPLPPRHRRVRGRERRHAVRAASRRLGKLVRQQQPDVALALHARRSLPPPEPAPRREDDETDARELPGQHARLHRVSEGIRAHPIQSATVSRLRDERQQRDALPRRIVRAGICQHRLRKRARAQCRASRSAEPRRREFHEPSRGRRAGPRIPREPRRMVSPGDDEDRPGRRALHCGRPPLRARTSRVDRTRNDEPARRARGIGHRPHLPRAAGWSKAAPCAKSREARQRRARRRARFAEWLAARHCAASPHGTRCEGHRPSHAQARHDGDKSEGPRAGARDARHFEKHGCCDDSHCAARHTPASARAGVASE